jgi:hypothetical protein
MLELDDGHTGIGFKILGNHYSNLYFIVHELNEGLYDYL